MALPGSPSQPRLYDSKRSAVRNSVRLRHSKNEMHHCHRWACRGYKLRYLPGGLQDKAKGGAVEENENGDGHERVSLKPRSSRRPPPCLYNIGLSISLNIKNGGLIFTSF